MLAGVGGQLPLQAVQLRLSLEGVLDSSHFKFYATLQKKSVNQGIQPDKASWNPDCHCNRDKWTQFV